MRNVFTFGDDRDPQRVAAADWSWLPTALFGPQPQPQSRPAQAPAPRHPAAAAAGVGSAAPRTGEPRTATPDDDAPLPSNRANGMVLRPALMPSMTRPAVGGRGRASRGHRVGILPNAPQSRRQATLVG
jgi:hypothetical protein